MSHTEPTSPNSSAQQSGMLRPVGDTLDSPLEFGFRPTNSGMEKRQPSIASAVGDAEILHLDPWPRTAASTGETGLHEHELDLDPLSRSLIVLPQRPRSHCGTRREVPAAHPNADLEMPSFDGLVSMSIAGDAEVTPPHSDLVRYFDGIDSPPAPERGWVRRMLSLVGSAWSFCWRECEINRSIAALSHLDDRTLRDIGIHDRLQIPDLVRNIRRGS